MTLEAKVCNYTGLSVKYIGFCQKPCNFTPVLTSTQDVLHVARIYKYNTDFDHDSVFTLSQEKKRKKE